MRRTSTATQHCNKNNNNPLKVNKDSHFIKKSSASPPPPSHRHPVIIYTHSPKIIHTHPRDFMALVQKLTGLSRSSDDSSTENGNGPSEEESNNNGYNNYNNINSSNQNSSSNNKRGSIGGGNDEESTSVITTDENCVGDGQVNSCFVPPPIFEPPNPYLTNNIPVFTPNSADFLCSNQQFYNYTADSLLFSPNIRGAISSTSSEGINDFRDY